ncbi:porin, partial [Salmonella enterica subsp. enterica serovar Arechavaleta]|nr:porin [Salmonella enterica subsp. enterica serovar Arechavaleta]EJB1627349.1 porin [Salmonella enterica]
ALQYQGKNDGCGTEFTCGEPGAIPLSNNARELFGQNGDGFGMSLTYDFGEGFGAGAAYSNSNRTTEQKLDGNGNKAEAWTAGLKYDANNIYLAANYTQARNMTVVDGNNYSGFANKTDNWEAVAQYQFDNGLRPSLAYLQSRAHDTSVGDADLVKYTDIGMNFDFNKNMSAYVDYKINLLKNDNPAGLNTDNIVATGLVYQF